MHRVCNAHTFCRTANASHANDGHRCALTSLKDVAYLPRLQMNKHAAIGMTNNMKIEGHLLNKSMCFKQTRKPRCKMGNHIFQDMISDATRVMECDSYVQCFSLCCLALHIAVQSIATGCPSAKWETTYLHATGQQTKPSTWFHAWPTLH